MLTLIARVAGSRLALPASAVLEIHRAVLIAPLPGAPSVIEGVVHRRGQVLPVLDLAERLALPSRPVLSPDEHFVVLEAGGRQVVVRVDDAEEIREIDDGAIASADGLVAAARTVAGVARLDDGTITIHDPSAFLSQAEDDALSGALASLATPAGG